MVGPKCVGLLHSANCGLYVHVKKERDKIRVHHEKNMCVCIYVRLTLSINIFNSATKKYLEKGGSLIMTSHKEIKESFFTTENYKIYS